MRNAVTTQVRAERPAAASQTGYLGVALEPDRRGTLVIGDMGIDSPAEKAGLKKGDILLKANTKPVKSAEEFRAFLQGHAPGDMVNLSIQRGRKTLLLTATLAATSRPMKSGGQRAVMGVRMSLASNGAGIPIFGVTTNKPAAKAGLKAGDVILKVNSTELGEGRSLTDAMAERVPGETVRLLVRRGKEEFEKSVELVADDSTAALAPEDQRTLTPWKKDVYKLAVICVEFPDAKHNKDVRLADWQDSFFSHHTYTNQSATGQKAHGSVADYYEEISCGKIRVEGRVFDWVEAKKNRSEFNTGRTGSTRSNLFANALAAILKRDGANALKDFDGIGLIYAGAQFPGANRGSILWPHRSSITIKGKSWPYVIVAEGGERMATISTMCHETGHILGLPDLYARPENPGSEGAGPWCAMSNQSRDGRPQHFSAWCKEQLGWLTPAVIDPAVKQKLVLAPIENSPSECFKVLVRPDGSEYFLLENRRKIGFDASLAAEGLLIWRVVANRPILEEAHGIDGPNGPRVFLTSVPYPSKANNAFTPYTTPASRSQLGGGKSVFIANIQKLSDGRIAFDIGSEFQ